MAVRYREVIYKTNNFARVHIFPIRPMGRGRGKKNAPTKATQERLNRKNAAHRLTDLINLNFDSTSYSLRMNYSSFFAEHGRNPSDEEIKRENHNFMRKLKRKYDKVGAELKWVMCTEVGARGGLVHHHVVISGGIELDEIIKAWKCGGVGFGEHGPHLYFDELGAYDLARYMVKERYTYRSYSTSRNLIRPQERREIFRNDNRISQKRFCAIASNDVSELNKLYPDWAIAQLPEMEYAIDCDTGEVQDAIMSPFLTLYLYKPEGLSDPASRWDRIEKYINWEETDVKGT